MCCTFCLEASPSKTTKVASFLGALCVFLRMCIIYMTTFSHCHPVFKETERSVIFKPFSESYSFLVVFVTLTLILLSHCTSTIVIAATTVLECSTVTNELICFAWLMNLNLILNLTLTSTGEVENCSVFKQKQSHCDEWETPQTCAVWPGFQIKFNLNV